MRRICLIALLVLALAGPVIPARAAPAPLTPEEQLEQMKKDFEDQLRSTRDAYVPRATIDRDTSTTIQELRSEVQSLTVAIAGLEQRNNALSEEVSSTIAARAEDNAAAAALIADLEARLAEAEEEIAAKRPLFWRDPADWAAILSGLAAGSLLGVVLTSRRRR